MKNIEVFGDQSIAGLVRQQQLTKSFVKVIPDGTTVLDVIQLSVFKLSSTNPVTITAINNGQDGQQIAILGDGNSTYAGVLLTANKIYRFTYILGTWYPDV